MAEPFLSEIRLFSFNFPPKGWAFCNGQILLINQNQALFSLLGTTYGGNGQTNFALPNMQGCVPIHSSNERTLGQKAGASSVTITQQTMPQHIHVLSATSASGNSAIPSASVGLATSTNYEQYRGATNLVAMNPGSVTNVGASQPHNNMMPYQVLNFCIALQGIFPSPN